MKWSDIRKQYPDKFILLGDLKEERLSDTKYRILEGTILKISDDAKEIRMACKQCKTAHGTRWCNRRLRLFNLSRKATEPPFITLLPYCAN